MHGFMVHVGVTLLSLIFRLGTCLDKTTQHVCLVNSSINTFVCCPDYYEEHDMCKPCKAGTYGKNCTEKCPNKQYGLQCKSYCVCKRFEICDMEAGCVCPSGYKGNNCTECDDSRFSLNCTEDCSCAVGLLCEKTTGKCLCNGQNNSCNNGGTDPISTIPACVGMKCFEECKCNDGLPCTKTDGKCLCSYGPCKTETSETNRVSPEPSDLSSHFIVVYIGMAAALLALIGIVVAVVKLKQKLHQIYKQTTVKSKLKSSRSDLTTRGRAAVTSSTPEDYAMPSNYQPDSVYYEIEDVSC